MYRFIALLFVSGCASIPPAVQYASTAAGIGVWTITGKSTTDHLLSYITNQNCAMIRALDDDDVCVDNGEDE
ncbi:MAG: hypothetical protein EBU90_26770 [Proteobacteria bacterium]|nr:hypothetical protein [Pseudomonadota bacterium]